MEEVNAGKVPENRFNTVKQSSLSRKLCARYRLIQPVQTTRHRGGKDGFNLSDPGTRADD